MTPPAFALGFASGICATLGLLALAAVIGWAVFAPDVRKALGG